MFSAYICRRYPKNVYQANSRVWIIPRNGDYNLVLVAYSIYGLINRAEKKVITLIRLLFAEAWSPQFPSVSARYTTVKVRINFLIFSAVVRTTNQLAYLHKTQTLDHRVGFIIVPLASRYVATKSGIHDYWMITVLCIAQGTSSAVDTLVSGSGDNCNWACNTPHRAKLCATNTDLYTEISVLTASQNSTNNLPISHPRDTR